MHATSGVLHNWAKQHFCVAFSDIIMSPLRYLFLHFFLFFQGATTNLLPVAPTKHFITRKGIELTRKSKRNQQVALWKKQYFLLETRTSATRNFNQVCNANNTYRHVPSFEEAFRADMYLQQQQKRSCYIQNSIRFAYPEGYFLVHKIQLSL